MKKIALFSLMVCCGMIDNAFSGSCGPSVTLAYVGNQKPAHDEFLYISKTEYDKSVSGWENSSHYTSGDGHGYECDNDFCPNGHVIEMPSGHVFKGQVVNRKVKYQCWTAAYSPDGDDMWIPVNNGMCKTKWGNLEVGKRFVDVKTTTDCSGLAKSEENTGLVKNWKVYCLENLGPGLICKPNECVEGYTVKNDKCVSASQCRYEGKSYNIGDVIKRDVNCNTLTQFPDTIATGKKCELVCKKRVETNEIMAFWAITECPENTVGQKSQYTYIPAQTGFSKCVAGKVDPDPKPDPKKKTCEELHPGASAERLACCRAGNKTTWSGTETSGTCTCKKGTWNYTSGKYGTCEEGVIGANCQRWMGDTYKYSCCMASLQGDPVVVFSEGVCACIDTTKTWNGEQCVGGNNNHQDTNCWYQFSGSIRCTNGNSVDIIQGFMLSAEDLNGMSCTEFKQSVGENSYIMQALFRKYCTGGWGAPVNNQALIDAQATMNRFTSSAESSASVWKDSEGKFNTARLASDLTAGVVLGTVGGVVSGVVIKKKQVEKGFDALHCTVGGQKIADWGDTFTVGLQR